MTKKENEILSRRSFFKKAAGIVIPAVAMVALPSVMTSCEIDEEYPDVPSGGSSGSGGGCSTCSGGCGASCASRCRAAAKYTPAGCHGSCKNACTSCRSLCYGSSK